MLVSNRALGKKGMFVNKLDELQCTNYKKIYKKYVTDKNKKEFDAECELLHDKTLNKYYLNVCVKKTIEIKKTEREPIVAIDEGEKTFASFYSINKHGKIGDNMRRKILKIQKEIKKGQHILDTNINLENKVIKNKRRLRRRNQRRQNKIKGYVNEIHKKAAKYLCENYERILLPKFETKPMISKTRRENEYKRIHKIENKTEAKKELVELNKKIKMSKKVKYVLGMQSHYKFKEYLKSKAEEYGTKIYDVTEEYTSQCCTKCGHLSKEYKNREKECQWCEYKIDRDIGASRNILIKNMRQIIKSS
jgi:putative transposase